MRWCDCLHQSLGPIINYVNDLSRYGRTFWHFNFFLSFFNFMTRKLIRLLRKKCVGNLIGKPALTFMSVCSFVINDFIRWSPKLSQHTLNCNTWFYNNKKFKISIILKKVNSLVIYLRNLYVAENMTYKCPKMPHTQHSLTHGNKQFHMLSCLLTQIKQPWHIACHNGKSMQILFNFLMERWWL